MASNGRPITTEAVKWLWPLIVAAITAGTSWGIIQTQTAYYETRICSLETKMERTQETYAQIQTQLAEIQRDLQYLRRDVDRQGAEP